MPAALIGDLDDLDCEAMKVLIRTQHEQLSSRASEIAHLKLLLDKLQRMLFGAESEKLVRQVAQLELQLEELETSCGEEEVSSPLPFHEPAEQKPRTSSRKLPEHLPREIETHHPTTSCCPGCGGTLREFGEDVSEVLEYVPESFKVVRHVRPKFSCGRCETVVEAPAPSRPIPRSYAGPGLLSHVLVAKYCDHSPPNRQSEIYAREGVDLDRSTLAGWVGASAALLDPLVQAVRHHVFAGTRLHADDRGPREQVFVRGVATRPFRCSHPAIEGRRQGDSGPTCATVVHVPILLHQRSGRLLARPSRRTFSDPSQELPRSPASRYVCGISSALRRRKDCRSSLLGPHPAAEFHDILAAAEAVHRIDELYAVEKQVRGSPPEIRFAARQARAMPIMEDLRHWLDRMLQNLSAKSDMAGAIRYALTRWTAVTRYLDDGTVEIDNNAAERALRVVALGRKNYLFASSNRGGERAAAIYSLLGTAKLNGINPERYLRYVLTHIAEHPINRIAELLSWNVPSTHATPITTDA